MSIIRLSWSGGADSTAAAVHHIRRGDHLKMVYYVPMFTETFKL